MRIKRILAGVAALAGVIIWSGAAVAEADLLPASGHIDKTVRIDDACAFPVEVHLVADVQARAGTGGRVVAQINYLDGTVKNLSDPRIFGFFGPGTYVLSPRTGPDQLGGQVNQLLMLAPTAANWGHRLIWTKQDSTSLVVGLRGGIVPVVTQFQGGFIVDICQVITTPPHI